MILLSDYLFYVIIVKRSVEKARGQHAMDHIQIVGGTFKIRPFGTRVLLFSSNTEMSNVNMRRSSSSTWMISSEQGGSVVQQ